LFFGMGILTARARDVHVEQNYNALNYTGDLQQ